MTEVTGPFDLSINQQCGLLVEGYDQAPMMMMNYNPPWYPVHLESCGFETAVETLAYRGSPRYELPTRVARLLARVSGRLEIRPGFARRDRQPGRTHASNIQRGLGRQLGIRAVDRGRIRSHGRRDEAADLRPGYVQVAVIDGEFAGFIVALPDLNELVADLHGRLFPFGAPAALADCQKAQPSCSNSAHGHIAEVPAVVHGRGHQLRIDRSGCTGADRRRHRDYRAILDSGRQSRHAFIVEAIGMQVAQRFRIYRKRLIA